MAVGGETFLYVKPKSGLSIYFDEVMAQVRSEPAILDEGDDGVHHFTGGKPPVTEPGLYHELPRAVVSIANELVASGKLLDVQRLYKMCKQRLNATRNELIDTIHLLLGSHVLVEGTLFTRETVVENKYRKKIMALIEQHGAMHFSRIKKLVFEENPTSQGSSGQLLWHLGLLLKFRLIRKGKVENKTIFFLESENEELAGLKALFHDASMRKIVSTLATTEYVHQATLYNGLNEKHDKISYRLKKMKEMGLIIDDPHHAGAVMINPDKKHLVLALDETRKR